ncbi:MAG TPA: arsenic resistance N-acetyltransferase ArsN2 [Anaeromyxobacteraceae bacterium]
MGRSPQLEPATPADVEAIRSLLEAAGLPSADLGAPNQRFLVAREAGALLGCVGLELFGEGALLRSLAVAERRRGEGLGGALAAGALEEARRRGVRALYLLTTTAEGFFARRGFARIGREEVPEAVRGSAEFGALCPASAACMARRLA